MSGVLLLAGPTAGGKTDLAIELARTFDAEIVGADSRQIYRGMPIGTAAPTPEQLAAVPHHLIGFLDPHERYSAARFARDAMAAIDAIHARGRRAIVVGGTGFYVRALRGGVELAAAYDEGLRARLAAEARAHPAEFLHEWLALREPRRAAALAPNDTYRVLRALEVALAPVESRERAVPLRTLAGAGMPHALIVLDLPNHVLDARIEARVATMLVAGLTEEAERVGSEAVAASAVGYPQAHAYLRGGSSDAELRASRARATRRYARRQRAWFRREPGARFVDAIDVAAAAKALLGW